MARGIGELNVVLVYEPTVAALLESVALGLEEAGADLTAGAIHTVSPDAAASADLIVIGGPATSLLSRRRSHGVPSVRPSPESADLPTFRSWLAAVPAVVPTPRGARRARRPRLVATFDTRVSRLGRTHVSASSQAATWLTQRGYGLAGLPMSFLLDSLGDGLACGESARAQRWAYGVAQVAWARLRGMPTAWWANRADLDEAHSSGTDHSTTVPLASPGSTRH